MADFDVQVTARGPVSRQVEEYAVEKVSRLGRFADRDILMARVALDEGQDPAVARHAVAKASLDVSGRVIRAHVAAERMDEAIDILEERLRRQLERVADSRGPIRATSESPEGEWRRGALPTARPPYFPRPVEQREIIAHKTYALAPLTPEEAWLEMDDVDHDFYLFTDHLTGQEALVYRAEGGGVGLMRTGAAADAPQVRPPIAPDPVAAPVLSLEQATARLDTGGEPFVFFVEAESGRGRVIYRRYDGHYGLIIPASETG